MKRYRKHLRYYKIRARFFRKNNISEINIDNNFNPIDMKFNNFTKPHKTITVTFTDGTQKEAKSYRVWPPKIEYKEDDRIQDYQNSSQEERKNWLYGEYLKEDITHDN